MAKAGICGTAITARSIFYSYRRKSKKLKMDFLEYGDYRKFITEFHKAVADECANNKFEYKAPCRLGTFKIVKKKHNFLINKKTGKIDRKYVMINWKETKALWENKPETKGKKLIYFTNPHTGGYYFKWEWSRTIAAFANMEFYIFVPVRQNKKILNEAILKDAKYDAYLGTKSTAFDAYLNHKIKD